MSYNNAFFNGVNITYGIGDFQTYYPFSLGADVVAHEFSHGWTWQTSNLEYKYQSGALNEAFSDIFGAVVERYSRRKSITDTFLVGEDIMVKGGAFRNMANPSQYGYEIRHSGIFCFRFRVISKSFGSANGPFYVHCNFAFV
jgi:Zn-dependent metalloprotease